MGAFGSLSFDPARSTTIAVFSTTFPRAAATAALRLRTRVGSRRKPRNVQLFHAANVRSNAVDGHALRPSAGDETWYPNFNPGYGSGFQVSAIATYEFRATAVGTAMIVADKLGVVVAADDPIDLFLYQSSGMQQALLGCPSRPEAAVAACTR